MVSVLVVMSPALEYSILGAKRMALPVDVSIGGSSPVDEQEGRADNEAARAPMMNREDCVFIAVFYFGFSLDYVY